ncbi:DUF1697 domain-containing protein [Candidatus Woesearchaeota archaeon]|nr:DUF1697 domain-containing protein [Candidatus Woesearchaeota archaeon]
MHTYISFLRGINVAGQKIIKMSDLTELYLSLGFKNVQTVLQSGNVIFQSTQDNVLLLSEKIERAIKKKYGFTTTTIIRTVPELKDTIDANPFVTEHHEDVTKLHVAFLSAEPSASALTELALAKKDEKDEHFFIGKKVLYLFLPTGSGKAILSNAFLEKKLKIKSTLRKWNSVLKITEAAEAVALKGLK